MISPWKVRNPTWYWLPEKPVPSYSRSSATRGRVSAAELGQLCTIEPEALGAELRDAGEIACEPKVGRLVLFGDLLHAVPVYDGAEPRITIAFDVAKVA